MREALACIGLVAVVGCYEPPSDSCTIRCTPGVVDSCPDGLACNAAAFCATEGETCMGPSIDFASIGVGARHACGLSTNGDVYCWGDNDLGQLGRGTAGGPKPVPARIDVGPLSKLTVGSEHTCGLASGKAFCWGQNADGQSRGAGPGTSPTPVDVLAVIAPLFDQISAGALQTCAIGERQMWCWGHEWFTNGTPASQATRIGTLSDWISVSSGYDHTCGISESAGILCWGENDEGQIGKGDILMIYTTPTVPDGLPSGMQPLAVTAGTELTCAIMATPGTAAGGLWCWGRNTYDTTVIDDSGANRFAATRIGTAADWTAIVLGDTRACGQRAGSTWCWGTSYTGGMGGGIWSVGHSIITDAIDIGVADQIVLQGGAKNGREDADVGCKRIGTDAWCWGDNAYGQLAVGNVSRHPTPVEIPAPSGGSWARVVAGPAHTCAVTDGGAPWCWGSTAHGAVNAGIALGANAPCVAGEVCDLPTPVAAPSQVTHAEDLIAGDNHTCVLDAGAIRCWGHNYRGYLGVTNPSGVTTVIAPTSASWSKLMGGDTGTCGVTDAGALACWGWVAGTIATTPMVRSESQLQNLIDIQFADGFGCGVNTSLARVCWGENSVGQLGNGGTSFNGTPTLADQSTIRSLSARDDHACAVTSTDGIKCWGSNAQHESGHATRGASVTTPVDIQLGTGPLRGCTQVAVADEFSCAICGGRAYCWGSNFRGTLGRGVAHSPPTPVVEQVVLPSDQIFVEIATGTHHACARSMTNKLYCWGDALRGAIGNGTQSRNLPTPVGQ